MDGDTVTVGSVRITALGARSPDDMPAALSEEFPAVPAEAWAPYSQRFPASFATPTDWAIDCNPWLVRTPHRTALIDTGDRRSLSPEFDAPVPLLEALAARGVEAQEIDLVFLTHLDRDHVGGAVTPGRPTFPRARYVAIRAEWDHVRRPASRTRYELSGTYLDALVFPLAALGVLDLVAGQARLTDEITVIPAPGHTPGHSVVLVASQGEQALLLSDTVHHPAQLTELGWNTRYDDDPAAAAATRARLAEWAARDKLIIGATHFPTPGFGRVVANGDRLGFEAL
jgi:glyoxylase-like metal-dependent hydrolase (beta-lactamase superfamily II)